MLEIHLKTLTPIWTGGVETGKMDRLHETGIIGSLRWWYEAIVRGLGGHACDPTEHTCIYDKDKPNNNDICDVCKLFGTTGWRRRFQLQIIKNQLTETWTGGGINIKPPDRNRGWYLNAGQMGTLTIKIVAEIEIQAQILALMQFIARYGSIGARPQLGYGLINIVSVSKLPQPHYNWGQFHTDQTADNPPNLRKFTFFNLTFEPQHYDWWTKVPGIGSLSRDRKYRNTVDRLLHYRLIPISPALKNVLRYGVEWSSGGLPHQFFGTLQGENRRRSKIAISWAYQLPNSSKWQIKGWAYPPLVGKKQQQEIAQRLQAVLGAPETWLRALGINYRSAEVNLAPSPLFFQPIMHEQVKEFVEQTSLLEEQI